MGLLLMERGWKGKEEDGKGKGLSGEEGKGVEMGNGWGRHSPARPLA